MSVYLAEIVRKRSTAFWSVVGLKGTLVALLLLPATNPDWQQYEDKAMQWRILVFPLAALVVPVLWRIAGNGHPYPHLADGLLVAAPLTDVLWNTFDAYDQVWWWDKLVHLVNSVLIAYAIALWLRRYALGSIVPYLLVLGMGMTFAVGWELAEYWAGAAGTAELQTYGDTLGDLSFALLGSAAAAALAARQPSADRGPDAGAPAPALAEGCQ